MRARACVCVHVFFVCSQSRWLEDLEDRESFPSKAFLSLFATFFWSMPGRDLENRLENITENEDGVIVGGRDEKERERRT